MIELLTVIVLLGVLGITAFGRFSGTSAYRPSVVASLLVAELGLAQQTALSRADVDTVWRLTTDANELTLTTLIDGTMSRQETIEHGGVVVNVSSGATSGAVSSSESLLIGFGRRGDVSSVTLGASSGDASFGAAITLTGSRIVSLCLYPTGLVTRAACL